MKTYKRALAGLIDLFWQKCNIIFPAAIGVIILMLIILPVKFYYTDVLMKTPKLPDFIVPLTVFVIVFPLSFIDWRKVFSKMFLLLLGIAFIAGLYSYKNYKKNKAFAESVPKIYAISPSRGCQGTIIEITGKNFLPSWQKGRILIGDEEVLPLTWEESRITVEQPVLSSFGEKMIYIKRVDEKTSNQMKYFIINPADLK